LERSVALAAAMDARGYGRTAQVPRGVRRATAVLTLGGLLGVCAGTYALLASAGAGYGLPVLLAGLAAAVAGLRLGGRRTVRTRYRPDRWGPRAWLVAGSGVAVAALLVAASSYAPAALDPPAYPLTAPTLPLWPALSLLPALIPAFATPRPDAGRPDPARLDAGRWDPGRLDAGRLDAGRPYAGRLTTDRPGPDPGRGRAGEPRRGREDTGTGPPETAPGARRDAERPTVEPPPTGSPTGPAEDSATGSPADSPTPARGPVPAPAPATPTPSAPARTTPAATEPPVP
jgi:energy-coupling factor transport system permease protein